MNEEQRIQQLKKVVSEHSKAGLNDEGQHTNKPSILQMADHQLESIRSYSNIDSHAAQDFTELPKSSVEQGFHHYSSLPSQRQWSHVLNHPPQSDGYQSKTYDTTTPVFNPSSHAHQISIHNQNNHHNEEEQFHGNTFDDKITSSTAAMEQVEISDQDNNHYSNSYTQLERLVSQTQVKQLFATLNNREPYL